MSSLELMYLYHYQELAIKEQQQYLTNILGVIWDKKTLLTQSTPDSTEEAAPVNELFIPLSLAINPDVLDFVRGQFGLSKGGKPIKDDNKNAYIGGGEYNLKTNEVVHSMADLSKDDFMMMLGKKKRDVVK